MVDLLKFPETSRVWIYTSKRVFSDDELNDLQSHIDRFTRAWVSHNVDLHATGGILHNRFLVLVVDESRAGASGCSIDSSVHFIRQLGEEYQTDFFDRQLFTCVQDEEVTTYNRPGLKKAYQEGSINDQTPFFDTLVQNMGEFQRNWLKPLGDSWLKRLV